MKLIKRIGALLITVAMLCSLIVFVPNNVSTVKAIAGGGIPGNAPNLYWGCDVSFYNVGDNSYANGSSYNDSGADYSLVNFQKMKADGCDFVILRIGSEDSSGYYIDPHFYTFYDMAREAGMDVGLYYYSYALTYAEAAAEARFVIDAIEGMYFEYPIYIDIEESNQMTSSIAPNISLGWCETMVDYGYFPGIYGNYSLYDVLTTTIKNTYDTWIAWVSSATSISSYSPNVYNLSNECGMWQYSFYGYEYDGIGLDMLDVNVAYKDYPAIMAQYGYNNVSGNGNTVPESYKPTIDADGNYTFENAYGFEFDIDDIDGVIDGEDATIITNAESYATCNPNWAISVQLRPTATSGEYEVVKVVPTPGSAEAAGLVWEEGDIVMVVHSANSQPGYANWMSKVAALTLKAGDIVTVSDDMTTVTIPDLDGPDPEDPVVPGKTVINSIELTTTSAVIAGNTIFTPTVKSINGDASLVSAATSATLTQWWNEAGSSMYASGTVFEEGVVYDLYFKLTCNSGYEIADNCTMTIETANGTFTGEVYPTYTNDTNAAFDFMITAAAAGTTPDPDPSDKVISSIEIVSTGTAAAGNALYTATLASINGDVSLISAATSGFSMQWYDEAGVTPLYASSTNFEEGTVYDLYIKVTRSGDYTFADEVTYTLTTPDGTYNGTIYANETTDTVKAFDFYVTGLAGSGTTDPVEKFVINSLEFEVSADDPKVGNSVFTPSLISINGDASLLSYINEAHTKWYTSTGYTVTEYNNTVFEALNVGYKYDLYFSATAEDTAEFAADCVLTLTTNNRTHSATMYVYDASTISFDIYFETETVVVPDQSVFITGFNTSIVAGAAQIFTPDFNGDGNVSNSTANVTWTANLIAKYDEELEAYVVKELIVPTESGCTVDYTLAEDEIFIAVHWDDSETDGTTQANRDALMAVQPGMLLEFNNIDVDTKTIGTNPTIEFYTFEGPIVSLGAKINESIYGIRFGATYNKVFGYGEVVDIGFLLISEYRLGDNTLDLNLVNDYVVKVQANTIVEYEAGKAFEDYTTFTFYATVARLDRKDNLDDNIVAIPYITYSTGKTFYGKQMMNSYNGVLDGVSSFS